MLTLINIDIILGLLCLLIEYNKCRHITYLHFLRKYTCLNKFSLAKIWAGAHVLCILLMIMLMSIYGAVAILFCVFAAAIIFWACEY